MCLVNVEEDIRMVLIDIDGVLAWGNIPQLARLYNRLAKLGIAEASLQAIETREAFGQLPQVQAHISGVGEERYQQQLARMQFHPLYVHQLNVMPGALVGVRYLARRVGEALSYCTARVVNFNDAWNEHLQRVTRIWLKENDFPNAEQVMFCDGIPAKLAHIAALVREQEQPVLLIDDNAEQLLLAFMELPQAEQALLSRWLTIAAFGYEDCPDGCPLPVIPFSNWGEVINLAVEKEFKYYAKSERSGLL